MGSGSHPLNPCSRWKFGGSDSLSEDSISHLHSAVLNVKGQVKTLCDSFSSVETGQSGKQQIIKLMSTFIAVRAVKASHGFLIKSHKAYLQSHIIFLVIQTSNFF